MAKRAAKTQLRLSVRPFIVVPTRRFVRSAPMAGNTQKLIEKVHASKTMVVTAVAGAGAGAISQLLSAPGASRTVLEALVAYSPGSLAELLGYKPLQAVSLDTATAMARRAYQRALHLRNSSSPIVGVGCTAAIATDRPRRGEHRAYVATWSQTGTTTYSLDLAKGLRERQAEEKIVSSLVLRAISEASQVDFDLAIDLDSEESIRVSSLRYEDPIKALLAGHVDTVKVHPDGRMAPDEPVRGAVLPGAFDPFHEGHAQLAAVASTILKMDVTFELAAVNVDKPPLADEELRRRVAQFAGKWPLVVSRAPLFVQKAHLFPGCSLVVGWDTAKRLFDPRYHGGDEFEMMKALDEIRRLGCRFLVAGRVDKGAFRTLDDVAVPEMFQDMLTAIPASDFRYDLSSTEMRPAGPRR